MVLTVSISPEVEARLVEKARAAGVDLSTYVAALIEQTTRAPLLIEQIAGDAAEQFTRSGITDDEVGDILERAKHEMRARKRSGGAP
jgi:hypothetical protein